MPPNVVYFWTGKAKAGEWVGMNGKWFLIDDPHYDTLTDTKAILPYNPDLVGLDWEDAEAITKKLAFQRKGA